MTSFGCSNLIPFLNSTLSTAALPPATGTGAIPKYTDIQRIFNKNCIECHGGLDYPPYDRFGGGTLDLSENENPPAGQDRLDRSFQAITGFMSTDPADSFIFQRITDNGSLTHPYDPLAANENCPFGLMPCAGPPISLVDIETIRRWIVGSSPNTRGDPHIETVDGVPYDFQSAGEFVLLRGQGLEIQVRQAAVETNGPIGPNDHTGLNSCASLNIAVAIKVGPHRITYQPNPSGRPDPEGMQLHVDGKLSNLGAGGIILQSGGRILQTTVRGGLQIETPGGSTIVVTPAFWTDYQVWYLNVDTSNVRATEGVMGALAPGSWLPALPDGSSLGPKPRDLHQRYVDLYETFERAWRVTDATSLFDYAPGTSTATFTNESWPEENPTQCRISTRIPGGPITRLPLKILPLETAQQQCRAIVADNARKNCIADVMVTGEPKFAETYLAGEQLARNAKPTAPKLVFPERFKTDVALPVDFTWDKTTDRDGDPVTYKHCVWPTTEKFHLNRCTVATTGQVGTTSLRSRMSHPVVVAVVGLLLLVVLFFLGLRKKPWILGLAVVVIVAAVCLAFYMRRGSQPTMALASSGLQSGKAYYWKVIVEDGKGGTTESEMRRFDVK